MRRATGRATAALLHRLPHPAESARSGEGRSRRVRGHRPDRRVRGDERDERDRRLREAGGPMDNASYSCACGLVFAAAVSTTVSCPHCGADQAW